MGIQVEDDGDGKEWWWGEAGVTVQSVDRSLSVLKDWLWEARKEDGLKDYSKVSGLRMLARSVGGALWVGQGCGGICKQQHLCWISVVSPALSPSWVGDVLLMCHEDTVDASLSYAVVMAPAQQTLGPRESECNRADSVAGRDFVFFATDCFATSKVG